MNSVDISNKLAGKSFSKAIDWVRNNLINPEMVNMGDHRIARFKVSEAEFSHIMFFDHAGIATPPSYCFN